MCASGMLKRPALVGNGAWEIQSHYHYVKMTTLASQITSLTVVYSTVYSDADQRKHQSSASLAFVWGSHRDRWIPRTKGQSRGKCFHLMTSSWYDKMYGVPWKMIMDHGKYSIEQNVWVPQENDNVPWKVQNKTKCMVFLRKMILDQKSTE